MPPHPSLTNFLRTHDKDLSHPSEWLCCTSTVRFPMYICAAHHCLVSVHQVAFCYIFPMGGSPILTTCTYNNNHGGLHLSILHALFFHFRRLLLLSPFLYPSVSYPDLPCKSPPSKSLIPPEFDPDPKSRRLLPQHPKTASAHAMIELH